MDFKGKNKRQNMYRAPAPRTVLDSGDNDTWLDFRSVFLRNECLRWNFWKRIQSPFEKNSTVAISFYIGINHKKIDPQKFVAGFD